MSADRRVAYINARLLDPATGRDEQGALLTLGGKIAELGASLFADGVPEGTDVVDCAGACVSPGLIDMHVFLGEALETTALAAAAGGVTTIVVQPDMDPILDQVALVDYMKRRGLEAPINVHAMAAATKGFAGEQMTEIGMLTQTGALGFTDSRKAITNANVLRRLLTYASAYGALIVQHAEEPALAQDGCANEGEIATRLGLPDIPSAAEVIMLERDIRLVELAGGRYHAAQLSTAAAFEAIRSAKSKGLPVTCGATPAHFALNELALEEYRTFAKISPPLRSEDDRKATVAAIADGAVDVIVSAHDPHDEDSKRLPFTLAAPGVVGLETMLPLALELYHAGHVPLLRVLGAMTCGPADLLGLPAGRLKEDAPADLVIFDPDTPRKLDSAQLHSKAKNSPFDGRPVQGQVLRTVVAGETVFENGK